MITHAEQKTVDTLRRIGFPAGPLLFGVLLLALDAPPAHPHVPAMAATAALMAVWWLTEAVPLAATSLVPLVLFPLLGISEPARVAGQYFNSTIALFLGGFLIALAMERWGLHRRIALTVVSAIGASPRRLVLGFLAASGFISMWISNTATATMMLPIGLAVMNRVETAFGAARARPLVASIMLSIAYGSTIGGVATLVGTPTNLVFVSIYRDTFPGAPVVSFGQWFVLGLPYALVALALVWLLLTRVLIRVDPALRLDRDVLRAELTSLGPLRREEAVVLGVFIAAALMWTFRQDLVLGGVTLPGWARLWPPLARLDDGSVAMLMAVILFIIPGGRDESGRRTRLLDASTFARVPWDILLLFGGGFALAAGFTSSGLSAHLAGAFKAVAGLPPWVTVVLVCLMITFLSELTSNTATAQMFLPVLAAWAVAHSLHPLMIMVPATISASMAFMLPVGTPPNAIAFSSGRVTISQMARVGFVLNLTSVILTVLACEVLAPAIFGYAPGEFPAWAAPK